MNDFAALDSPAAAEGRFFAPGFIRGASISDRRRASLIWGGRHKSRLGSRKIVDLGGVGTLVYSHHAVRTFVIIAGEVCGACRGSSAKLPWGRRPNVSCGRQLGCGVRCLPRFSRLQWSEAKQLDRMRFSAGVPHRRESLEGRVLRTRYESVLCFDVSGGNCLFVTLVSQHLGFGRGTFGGIRNEIT